ncbi:MAG: glycosyltransferase family A protein [Ornithinimicrobium sp.]
MSSVDVVIAVHTATRPLARAVASVVQANAARTRLTVVCHGVAVDAVAASVPADDRRHVTWMEHHDGVASASGPFNTGIRAARGDYVSIMGSDDWLQRGAVDAWLDLAAATGADCVMSRLALGAPTRRVPAPPVRPWLPQAWLADPVRDRLSYRSAPLGLVSTTARRRLGVELTEGMPVGGDVAYVTRLWCETRVAVARHGPGYVIGEHAPDRVTYALRPIRAELAFVSHLLAQSWFGAYPVALRRAVATKMLRIHLFGAVARRTDPQWWSMQERRALAGLTTDVLDAASGVADSLSRADHAVLTSMLDPASPATTLIEQALARRRHGHPQTLLPRRAHRALDREAPLRFMAASWWAKR